MATPRKIGQKERKIIEEKINDGITLTEIGEELGIHRSSVCRELQRTKHGDYSVEKAEITRINNAIRTCNSRIAGLESYINAYQEELNGVMRILKQKTNDFFDFYCANIDSEKDDYEQSLVFLDFLEKYFEDYKRIFSKAKLSKRKIVSVEMKIKVKENEIKDLESKKSELEK